MLPLLALTLALYRAHCSLTAMPSMVHNPGIGLRSQRERGALIGLHSVAM
jgi:hypothetical protein